MDPFSDYAWPMSDDILKFETAFPLENERRKERRFLMDLGAQLIDSTSQSLREPLEGRVLDISRNGLRMEVWHDAPVGARFSISLQYNDDDSLCLAEVIWKRETTKGMVYGLRVHHWTYLTPLLAADIRWQERKQAASDFEMDMQDVPVLRDVIFPFHADLSLGPQSGL